MTKSIAIGSMLAVLIAGSLIAAPRPAQADSLDDIFDIFTDEAPFGIDINDGRLDRDEFETYRIRTTSPVLERQGGSLEPAGLLHTGDEVYANIHRGFRYNGASWIQVLIDGDVRYTPLAAVVEDDDEDDDPLYRPGDRPNRSGWESTTADATTTVVNRNGREQFEIFEGEEIRVNWDDTRRIDGRRYVAVIDSVGQRGYIRADRVDGYDSDRWDDNNDDRWSDRWDDDDDNDRWDDRWNDDDDDDRWESDRRNPQRDEDEDEDDNQRPRRGRNAPFGVHTDD